MRTCLKMALHCPTPLLHLERKQVLITAAMLALGAHAATGFTQVNDDSQSSPQEVQTQKTAPGGSVGLLEEVVVTARRREESLFEIPVAVSSLDPAELARRNFNRTQDLETTIPSLSITTPFGEIGTTIVQVRLRGLTGVTTYFSEVPSSLSGNSVFVDLENVQVARGPQGTLFGKNAIGGAILFQPKRPVDDFEGSVKATIGNYGQQGAEVMLNLPIMDDTLAMRFNAVGEQNDGYTTVVGEGYKLDDKKHHYERLSVSWTPSDRVANHFVADNYFSHPRGPSNILDVVDPNGFTALVFGASAFDVLERQLELTPRSTSGGLPNPIQKTHAYRAINTLEWEAFDGINLKNISSYTVTKGENRIDLDGTALPLVTFATPPGEWSTNRRAYTTEFQLSGLALQDNLDWVTGIFLSRVEPNGPISDRRVNFGSPAVERTEVKSTNKGVYAQGTYKLTDRLNVTGGYRYNWDEKEVNTIRENDAGVCLVAGVEAGAPCGAVSKGDWTAGGWTLGLDYTTDNDHLIYARSSRAYNEGTFNANAPIPELFNVDPEYFTDIELGHKFAWNIGSTSGQSTLAAFYGDFTDVQYNVNLAFEDSTGTRRLGSFLSNAAEATVYGAEYSVVFAPVPELRLSANVTYNVAEFDDFKTVDASGAAIDFSGAPFAFFPEWKYDVSVVYDVWQNAELGQFRLSADYFWQDETIITIDLIPAPTSVRDSYDLLNLRLEWNGILQMPLDASVFVTNATDETYRASSIAVYSSAGFVSQAYAPPRMWGLDFSYRF